jgi:two-component system OmpR family response regulator
MRLLLVEDDPMLREQLKTDLQQAGYAVDTADNGLDAQFMGEQLPYDAVVLDLGLPGRSGMDVLRGWRAAGNPVAVLILTARDAWHEKVDGFKAGADDYLGKPFHVEELLARLSALLRRSHGRPGGVLTAGGLTLDEARQTVSQGGRRVILTGVEFRLLRYFMLNAGQVLSKTRLTEHVYEEDADNDSNVIEVYVNRLRRKLGDDVIRTRRGQGYVLGERA